MAKTLFIDGTPITPAFLNAINNPILKESPNVDGDQQGKIVKSANWAPDFAFNDTSGNAWIGQGSPNSWGDNGGFLVPFSGICTFHFFAHIANNVRFYFKNQLGIDLMSGEFTSSQPGYVGCHYGLIMNGNNLNRMVSGCFGVTKDDIVRMHYSGNPGLIEQISLQLIFDKYRD